MVAQRRIIVYKLLKEQKVFVFALEVNFGVVEEIRVSD